MPTPPTTKERAQEALDAFRANNNSKSAAARALNMNRATFLNRLDAATRYGLCRHDDLVSGVSAAVAAEGLPADNWSVAWLKQDDRSILVYNPDRDSNTVIDALADTIARVKKHSPKYPPLKFPKLTDPHLLVVNATDMHFGGYGLDEASRRLQFIVEDALARSAPYPLEQILFIGGNDLLHTDTAAMTTTKGTYVEHDGSSWAQAFEAAQAAYIKAIETLVQVAPVKYLHISGNHDELMGYSLSRVIGAWFNRHKNITFDVSDVSRKYVQFGSNLLAFTHGDKATKVDDIPMIMAQEAAEMWGKTLHRFCYMGHIHQTKAIKFLDTSSRPGVRLEWLRSPAVNNKWATDRGFISGAGFKTFIHSKERGRVASLSGSF